jgi:deazaflavin-dependent oxidoreductase (nitroreductase family)
MPLMGEYQPNSNPRDRKQVEQYEATNGAEGGTLQGKPVILLTYKGAKSGKVRKTPLMRIEHHGTYAVVASNGGAPTHPLWYRNLIANPLVELQDGVVRHEFRAREVFGDENNDWWKRADAAWPDFPEYRAVRAVKFRCSSWSRSRLSDLRTWENHRAKFGYGKGRGNLVRGN